MRQKKTPDVNNKIEKNVLHHQQGVINFDMQTHSSKRTHTTHNWLGLLQTDCDKSQVTAKTGACCDDHDSSTLHEVSNTRSTSANTHGTEQISASILLEDVGLEHACGPKVGKHHVWFPP